jgi:two-component system chemotaxis sensor kinase CheA
MKHNSADGVKAHGESQMSKTAEKLLPVLQKFMEDLETYSLNDHDAWVGFAHEVREALKLVPGQMRPLRRLLEVCGGALESIAAKALEDYLGMMDALAAGFEAARAYVEKRPDRDAAAAAALERLEQQSARCAANVGEDHDAAPGAGATLDDLAAQLLQMDDDAGTVELEDLRRALTVRRDDPATPTGVRSLLDEAVQLWATGGSPGEGLLAAAGRIIGQAMLAEEAALRPAKAAPPAPADPAPSAAAAPQAEPPQETSPAAALSPAGDGDERNYMPADPDLELIGEFVEEGSDLIAKAEEALLQLETDPEDTEAVGTVFRAFHTVKGTSAFLACPCGRWTC